MIEIPAYFFEVPYKGSHFPNSPKTNGLEGGANCQVFAYELLKYHGIDVPPFRSSDLWEDVEFTLQVSDLKPLDILLWNKNTASWGAHVGVYLGENQAIHLAKHIGFPVIWELEKFQEYEIYKHFIGAKRVKN